MQRLRSSSFVCATNCVAGSFPPADTLFPSPSSTNPFGFPNVPATDRGLVAPVLRRVQDVQSGNYPQSTHPICPTTSVPLAGERRFRKDSCTSSLLLKRKLHDASTEPLTETRDQHVPPTKRRRRSRPLIHVPEESSSVDLSSSTSVVVSDQTGSVEATTAEPVRQNAIHNEELTNDQRRETYEEYTKYKALWEAEKRSKRKGMEKHKYEGTKRPKHVRIGEGQYLNGNPESGDGGTASLSSSPAPHLPPRSRRNLSMVEIRSTGERTAPTTATPSSPNAFTTTTKRKKDPRSDSVEVSDGRLSNSVSNITFIDTEDHNDKNGLEDVNNQNDEPKEVEWSDLDEEVKLAKGEIRGIDDDNNDEFDHDDGESDGMYSDGEDLGGLVMKSGDSEFMGVASAQEHLISSNLSATRHIAITKRDPISPVKTKTSPLGFKVIGRTEDEPTSKVFTITNTNNNMNRDNYPSNNNSNIKQHSISKTTPVSSTASATLSSSSSSSSSSSTKVSEQDDASSSLSHKVPNFTVSDNTDINSQLQEQQRQERHGQSGDKAHTPVRQKREVAEREKKGKAVQATKSTSTLTSPSASASLSSPIATTQTIGTHSDKSTHPDKPTTRHTQISSPTTDHPTNPSSGDKPSQLHQQPQPPQPQQQHQRRQQPQPQVPPHRPQSQKEVDRPLTAKEKRELAEEAIQSALGEVKTKLSLAVRAADSNTADRAMLMHDKLLQMAAKGTKRGKIASGGGGAGEVTIIEHVQTALPRMPEAPDVAVRVSTHDDADTLTEDTVTTTTKALLGEFKAKAGLREDDTLGVLEGVRGGMQSIHDKSISAPPASLDMTAPIVDTLHKLAASRDEGLKIASDPALVALPRSVDVSTNGNKDISNTLSLSPSSMSQSASADQNSTDNSEPHITPSEEHKEVLWPPVPPKKPSPSPLISTTSQDTLHPEQSTTATTTTSPPITASDGSEVDAAIVRENTLATETKKPSGLLSSLESSEVTPQLTNKIATIAVTAGMNIASGDLSRPLPAKLDDAMDMVRSAAAKGAGLPASAAQVASRLTEGYSDMVVDHDDDDDRNSVAKGDIVRTVTAPARLLDGPKHLRDKHAHHNPAKIANDMGAVLVAAATVVNAAVTHSGYGYMAVDKGEQEKAIAEMKAERDKLGTRAPPLTPSQELPEDEVAHLPGIVRKALVQMETAFMAFESRAVVSPTHYTNMISTYGKLGLPELAMSTFERLRSSPDAVADATAYNVTMDVLLKHQKVSACVRLFEEMRVASKRDSSLKPDVVSYSLVMQALGLIGDKSGALSVFNNMRREGIEPNIVTWTQAIDVSCKSGDFQTGLRLLHQLKSSGLAPVKATYRSMIFAAGKGGQVKLAHALIHQMQASGMGLDASLFASLTRSLGEGGLATEAIRLHKDLTEGQFGPDIKPSQQTYNALLETLADPHSWGRLSMDDRMLSVGLAVYQEALVTGVFPHPYSERKDSGVLDLRPYKRGAVLFPIHFFLNLLVSSMPIVTHNITANKVSIVSSLTPTHTPYDRSNDSNNDTLSSSSSSSLDPLTRVLNATSSSSSSTSDPSSSLTKHAMADIAAAASTGSLIGSITSATGYAFPSASALMRFRRPMPGEKFTLPDEQTQSPPSSSSSSLSPSPAIPSSSPTVPAPGSAAIATVVPSFPRIEVPKRGILVIASKEIKPEWSAAPKPAPYNAGVKLRTSEGLMFDPALLKPPRMISMREYAENVLKTARPWVHYTILNRPQQQQQHQEVNKEGMKAKDQGSGNDNRGKEVSVTTKSKGKGVDEDDGNDNSKSSTQGNVLLLAPPTLRYWVEEQLRRMASGGEENKYLKNRMALKGAKQKAKEQEQGKGKDMGKKGTQEKYRASEEDESEQLDDVNDANEESTIPSLRKGLKATHMSSVMLAASRALERKEVNDKVSGLVKAAEDERREQKRIQREITKQQQTEARQRREEERAEKERRKERKLKQKQKRLAEQLGMGDIDNGADVTKDDGEDRGNDYEVENRGSNNRMSGRREHDGERVEEEEERVGQTTRNQKGAMTPETAIAAGESLKQELLRRAGMVRSLSQGEGITGGDKVSTSQSLSPSSSSGLKKKKKAKAAFFGDDEDEEEGMAPKTTVPLGSMARNRVPVRPDLVDEDVSLQEDMSRIKAAMTENILQVARTRAKTFGDNSALVTKTIAGALNDAMGNSIALNNGGGNSTKSTRSSRNKSNYGSHTDQGRERGVAEERRTQDTSKVKTKKSSAPPSAFTSLACIEKKNDSEENIGYHSNTSQVHKANEGGREKGTRGKKKEPNVRTGVSGLELAIKGLREKESPEVLRAKFANWVKD